MPPSELEAYFSNNRLKDGLARCMKLMKKSPNDPDLILYRAQFLAGLGQKAEVLAILSSLCNRKPPITDPSFIKAVESVYYDIELTSWPIPLATLPEAQKIWTNAISAATTKKQVLELHKARISHALEQRRWQDASTALVSFKKAAPPEMHARQLHIAVMQILADNEPNAVKADLNRTLAYRTVDQLDASQSFSDMSLKLDVYKRQGRYEELLRVWSDQGKNGKPTIPDTIRFNWDFLRLRISAFIHENRWDELLHYCESLMLDGSPNDVLSDVGNADLKAGARNDWTYWTAYLQASAATNDYTTTMEILNTIPGDNQRLNCLASLWVCRAYDERKSAYPSEDGQMPQDEMLRMLKEHFNFYQTGLHCFGDMKEFVLGLSAEQALEFRKHIAEAPSKWLSKNQSAPSFDGNQWLTAEINALQLEYALTIGSPGKPSPEFVESFVCNALRLVEVCGSGIGHINQLTMLAASALIRLHETDRRGPHLFQAACLLSIPAMLQEARGAVLLIYVLVEMGLYSQAMKWYKELNIKEIQHDTMSHMVMTRVSVTHPFGSASREWPYPEPYELVQKALAMYDVTDAKLFKTQEALLTNGRCNMLLELEEFRRALAHSVTRRILILEQRRIARLTDRQKMSDKLPFKPALTDYWCANLEDKRDFHASIHLGSTRDEETLEKRLHAGGRIPNGHWIGYQLIIDEVWSLLTGVSAVCDQGWEDSSTDEIDASQLTDMEDELHPVWCAMSTVTALTVYPLEFMKLVPRMTIYNLEEQTTILIKELESLPVSMVLDHETIPGHPPSSIALQNYFLLFDLVKAVHAWSTIATEVVKNKRAGQKPPIKHIERARQIAKSHFDSLASHAKRQRGKIAPKATQEFLAKGAVGEAVVNSVSSVAEKLKLPFSPDMFAIAVVNSTSDAWDGVLKVKLGK